MKREHREFRLITSSFALGLTLGIGTFAFAEDAPRTNPLRQAPTANTSAARPAAEKAKPLTHTVTLNRPVVPASGVSPELIPANPRVAGKNSVLVNPSRSITSQPTETMEPMEPMEPTEPRHSVGERHSMSEVVEGDVIMEGETFSGDFGDVGGMGGMEMGCADACIPCCLIPCPLLSLDNVQLFSGAQGFTGPTNRGETGSFGFNEGFNWGSPLACFPDFAAMQFGARAVQSNLSGADSTSENRNQVFVTGGLFRRVDWGLQGGLVVDYLSDDWYYNTDLMQLRGEISWVFPCSHELGFWFTAGTNNDSSPSVLDRLGTTATERWEPTDLYAFYYRHRFDECTQTEGRFYAGFTGETDGLLGADLRMPMNDRVAVSAGFAYLIPNEGEGAGINFGHAQESWNLGFNLIWYPGCGGSRSTDYARPLFNVADNGTFMVDRKN